MFFSFSLSRDSFLFDNVFHLIYGVTYLLPVWQTLNEFVWNVCPFYCIGV